MLAIAWLAASASLGCNSGGGAEGDAPAPVVASRPDSVDVEILGRRFQLELAADPLTRYRGLSGRSQIGSNAGMLFVFPSDAPRSFVMRDCPVPIDIAFLDAEGRVVAVHSMQVESPREPDESPSDYERRLIPYASGVGIRFAVETAGGRLADLGVRPGDKFRFDLDSVRGRAR